MVKSIRSIRDGIQFIKKSKGFLFWLKLTLKKNQISCLKLYSLKFGTILKISYVFN